MITRSIVVNELDEAEAKFRVLWQVLIRFKIGQALPVDVYEFQPKLARAIRRLDTIKERIAIDKNELVNNKLRYHPKWFAARMKTLNHYLSAAHAASQIGRSLGDSFVWFFLQESKHLIKYHKEHCPTNQIPKGIGGEGEIRLLECSPRLGDYFILYHGITSFLRIGDISLVSLVDSKLAAIGEIKTSTEDKQKLLVKTFMVANRDCPLNLPAISLNKRRKNIIQLPEKYQARLKRQLKTMGKTITVGAPDSTAEIAVSTYLSEFQSVVNSLMKNNAAYKQCGRSMLLIGNRFRKRKLSSKLLGTKRAQTKWLDEIPERILPIAADRDFPDALDAKSIKISHIVPCIVMGMTPLFWWPINAEMLQGIYFQDVAIFTAYNPAHLVQLFRSKGYMVNVYEEGRKFAASKTQQGYKLWLENIQWYFGLVEKFLFKEEAIVSIFESLMDNIYGANLKKSMKIEMNMMQED